MEFNIEDMKFPAMNLLISDDCDSDPGILEYRSTGITGEKLRTPQPGPATNPSMVGNQSSPERQPFYDNLLPLLDELELLRAENFQLRLRIYNAEQKVDRLSAEAALGRKKCCAVLDTDSDKFTDSDTDSDDSRVHGGRSDQKAKATKTASVSARNKRRLQQLRSRVEKYAVDDSNKETTAENNDDYDDEFFHATVTSTGTLCKAWLVSADHAFIASPPPPQLPQPPPSTSLEIVGIDEEGVVWPDAKAPCTPKSDCIEPQTAAASTPPTPPTVATIKAHPLVFLDYTEGDYFISCNEGEEDDEGEDNDYEDFEETTTEGNDDYDDSDDEFFYASVISTGTLRKAWLVSANHPFIASPPPPQTIAMTTLPPATKRVLVIRPDAKAPRTELQTAAASTPPTAACTITAHPVVFPDYSDKDYFFSCDEGDDDKDF